MPCSRWSFDRLSAGQAPEPLVDQGGYLACPPGGDEGPPELQGQGRRSRVTGCHPLERQRQQISRRPGVAVDHGAADGDQALVVGGVAGVAAGQQAHGDPLRVCAPAGQHVGRPAVEAAHDRHRRRVEHCPPQQVVPERQRGTVVREYPGLDGRQRGRQHAGERLVEQRRELLDAAAPRQDGGGPQQQLGVGDREECAPGQPGAQVLGHVGAPVQIEGAVADDDAAFVRQAGQQLDRQEGIAAGSGEQRGQVVARRRSEPGGDEGGEVAWCQCRRNEAHAFPGRHLLQAPQADGGGVRAGGGEDEDPQGAGPDGDGPQRVQTLVVGPVDVVGDECQGPGRRQTLGRRHHGTDRVGIGVVVELR